MSSPYKIFTVTTNIISFLALLVLFALFEKIITPFNRGFFCDDESIQHPYVERQKVPTVLLAILAVLMVILVVMCCDIFNYFQSDRKRQCDHNAIKILGRFSMKQWIYRIISRVFLAGIGFLMCLILTGIAKRMVGRLRPHFIAVCQPDYTKFNCTDGYITFDVCTSTDEKKLKEARLSFPSGHSSTSAFASLFFALYIQYAAQPRDFLLLKTFIQFCGVCLGVACSLTRISDYFHHWSDVLGGFILGSIFAVYTIYILMDLPNDEKKLVAARCSSSGEMFQENDIENPSQSTPLESSRPQASYNSINKVDKEL